MFKGVEKSFVKRPVYRNKGIVILSVQIDKCQEHPAHDEIRSILNGGFTDLVKYSDAPFKVKPALSLLASDILNNGLDTAINTKL